MAYYFITYLLTGIFFIIQCATGISAIFIQFAQLGPVLAAVIFIALEGSSFRAFFKNGIRFSLDRYTLGMILISILLVSAVSVLTTKLWGVQNFNKPYMSLEGVFLQFQL